MTSSDHIWTRQEIESPCIKICVVHPATRTCTGCGRTIDEISKWGRMTPQERQDIMGQLDARKAAMTQRRGGRAARLKRDL